MSDAIRQTLQQAVADGVFPSAQLVVSKNGAPIFHEAFGNATLETIFDIASLTKPISTTTLAMQLVAEDKLRLDDTVRHESKKKFTVRHLLSHSSGLPAWQPYYQTVPAGDIGKKSGKEEILNFIFHEPLVYDPGYQSIYSDLGFILLGDVIERASKKTLDRLFAEKIAVPLGLTNTFYNPLNPKLKTQDSRTLFAPTEDCPWRRKVVQGEVHDQNCYAMGGVAGHAGLFSNTTDINKFIMEFVAAYNGGDAFLPQEIIERFLPFRHKLTECNSTWLLGWDTPAHTNSAAGTHFSKKSVGHLGYTGCSMWIDLEKDFWIVLLTNRIHPTSTNEKIRPFRPMLYNLIYEELI